MATKTAKKPSTKEEPKPPKATIASLQQQLTEQIAATAVLGQALAGKNLCTHPVTTMRTCPRCQEADAALKTSAVAEGQRLLDVLAAARTGDQAKIAAAVAAWDKAHPSRDRFEVLDEMLAANPIKLPKLPENA